MVSILPDRKRRLLRWLNSYFLFLFSFFFFIFPVSLEKSLESIDYIPFALIQFRTYDRTIKILKIT